MLHERREEPDLRVRLRMDDAKVIARLRLFVLLALLVPLFAGLQFVVREGVPRVEVRLVAQDVQTTVPVEVPVERVVERVVYVPVGSQAAVPPTEPVEPVRAIVPTTGEAIGESGVQIGGAPTTDAPTRTAEPPAPSVVAEPLSEGPPLTGTVSLAPPPAPAAAPASAARPAPRFVAPPVEEPVAEEPEEIDVVAEAEAPALAPDDEEAVAEAEDDATEEVAVVQFVSEQPVVREDGGASISMLRHELYVREAKPETTQTDPIKPSASSADDEEPAPAAEEEAVSSPDVDEAAETPQAASVEQEAEQPAEGDEPVSEAKPISSEELLAQASSTTTEMLDQGANNEQSLGVLEHTLVARTAPAKPEPKHEEHAAEAESEGEAVAATPEDEESAAVAETEPAEDDVDEVPVADTGTERQEVARTDEEPEVEGEPEQ
ncbi:MAG TPA: hypothetical protein VFH48_16255 [Chloroflexota bacterium]|nr:hypothetical protein [Chloroflexota bacterium]